MNGIISVNDIHLYAFHGCLPEEASIGGNYIIDLKIFTDYTEASMNDDLSYTVDYCTVYEIVKREMAIRSNLIEHVACRIAVALKTEIHRIEKAEVVLTKIAPPLNGSVGSVSVIAVY